MTYIYAFDHEHDSSLDEMKWLVGGKGANLAVMTGRLGLPVPPGFTISTAACRSYLTDGWPGGLDKELREHIARLETAVGRRFGDQTDPLLVSVRSGAPVSMPGMMDTILNIGLNEATAAGIAALTGDPGFADACHQRLAAMYCDIVGVDRVPDDPWEQLRAAVEAVFQSWNGDRARSYRAHEGIRDDMATGVNVQAMVFGNRDDDSATGVVFTRNPATGENILYGDVLFNAQGEDVVAGTHATEPLNTLDERLPRLGAELRRYSEILERHYGDVCDIEFTIEQGKLWLLQTRIGKRSPQAALRIAVEMAEDPDFPLTKAAAVERVAEHLVDPPLVNAKPELDLPVAAVGLPASPGVVSGEIVTTPDTAVTTAASGTPVILVRKETSPDDVHGMAQSVGILTTTGGLASHAAVVARGWGIPAVVGASAVTVEADHVTIGDRHLAPGDVITIDGTSGAVLIGAMSGESVTVPEAEVLLTWAAELGIEIGAPSEGGTSMTESDDVGTPAAVPPDSLIRILVIKGFAMPEALAEALGTSEDEVTSTLDRLVADGVAGMVGAMFQLTDDGKAVGNELMAADREQWGPDNASRALDAFVALDRRVKEVVTAWQMREVNGEMTLNDHTDAAYDAGVLADLATLHADADAWLAPLDQDLPRLALYRTRLARAAELVATGDHQYIASPRLDSYHNVWFELHEDLILLAGRTREDEVAAGRA